MTNLSLEAFPNNYKTWAFTIACITLAIVSASGAQTRTQDGPAAFDIACTEKITADQQSKARCLLVYLKRSAAEQAQKRYDLSIADAKNAMHLNPKDPAVYVRLASAYQAAGNLDQYGEAAGMISMLGDQIFENLTYPVTTQSKYDALVARSYYEADLGLLDEAMADLNAAISMQPNSNMAYLARAEMYGNQNNLRQAISDINKAIAFAPTDVRPLYDQINFYEMEHRYADAVRDDNLLLRLLAADGPDNAPGPQEYNMRCSDQAHTANLWGALRDCQKSIALLKLPYGLNLTGYKYERLKAGRLVAEIYDSTGYVYLKLKYPVKAVYFYSAALDAYPTLASSLYGRALAEQMLHQTNAAATDFSTAKTIDPAIQSDFGT